MIGTVAYSLFRAHIARKGVISLTPVSSKKGITVRFHSFPLCWSPLLLGITWASAEPARIGATCPDTLPGV